MIDYVHILDGLNPLIAGRFENPHPVLMDGRNGSWVTIANKKASAGDFLQTQVAGDFMEFDFTGTGFAIGTHTGTKGSEMMVCYIDSGSFDGTWDGTGEQCVTYQNELQVPATRSLGQSTVCRMTPIWSVSSTSTTASPTRSSHQWHATSFLRHLPW